MVRRWCDDGESVLDNDKSVMHCGDDDGGDGDASVVWQRENGYFILSSK